MWIQKCPWNEWITFLMIISILLKLDDDIKAGQYQCWFCSKDTNIISCCLQVKHDQRLNKFTHRFSGDRLQVFSWRWNTHSTRVKCCNHSWTDETANFKMFCKCLEISLNCVEQYNMSSNVHCTPLHSAAKCYGKRNTNIYIIESEKFREIFPT